MTTVKLLLTAVIVVVIPLKYFSAGLSRILDFKKGWISILALVIYQPPLFFSDSNQLFQLRASTLLTVYKTNFSKTTKTYVTF